MRRLVAALAAALLLLAGCGRKEQSVNVPVLMYHHIDDAGGTDTIISEAGFRRQMDLIRDEGFTPISLDGLIAYGEGDGALPEKPVLITFDDGYESTYKRAWPILKDHGFPAAVFVIGVSVGRDTYKDTGEAMLPHFGLTEMAEMATSGTMAVQSHTYDMHQWGPFETGPAVRSSILPFEGEAEADYAAALREDCRREAEVLAAGGVDSVTALAYPLGRYTQAAEDILREQGVKVTLTTDGTRVNTVTRGQSESLYGLGRLNVSDGTTDQALLAYLER